MLIHFLTVMTEFFRAYDRKTEDDVFRRVFATTMNGVKSSNAITRASAVTLFQVALKRNSDPDNEEHCLNEILAPVKTSKSTGPDHRFALYSMLASISPSLATSASIVDITPTLLVKETNDATIARLSAAATPHFVFLLQNGKQIQASPLTSLVKEMYGGKPALRRATCSLVGDTLLAGSDSATQSDSLKEFTKAVVPAFEENLKAVTSNPLTAPAGPLEGYVALASLLGPVGRYKEFGTSHFIRLS